MGLTNAKGKGSRQLSSAKNGANWERSGQQPKHSGRRQVGHSFLSQLFLPMTWNANFAVVSTEIPGGEEVICGG